MCVVRSPECSTRSLVIPEPVVILNSSRLSGVVIDRGVERLEPVVNREENRSRRVRRELI